MANKFTWFPKLTEALGRMPEEPRSKMLWALVQYGTNGVEPDFGDDWALQTIFETLREDIDNSVNARSKNKGGRPPKGTSCAQGETGVTELENGGFEPEKPIETGVSEVSGNRERGLGEVSEGANPSLYTKPYQAIPSQTMAGQGRGDAPDAPSEDEVVTYFTANCLNGDPHAFFDFYASQGWRKSNGMPIVDWHAQAKQWHRKQREIDAEARSRGKPTASEVEAAAFRPVRKLTPEEELKAVDEEAKRYGIDL